MSDYIKKQDVLDILYNTFEEYNMTTDKQDKHGGFGAEVFKRVKEQPTFDEKEITRKPMERIIERIENARQKYQRLVREQGEKEDEAMNIHFRGVMQIVKEEGGIE